MDDPFFKTGGYELNDDTDPFSGRLSLLDRNMMTQHRGYGQNDEGKNPFENIFSEILSNFYFLGFSIKFIFIF